MLRRPEPTEWRVEATTLHVTAMGFPHSTRLTPPLLLRIQRHIWQITTPHNHESRKGTGSMKATSIGNFDDPTRLYWIWGQTPLKAEHLNQHDVRCTIPNDVKASLNLNQIWINFHRLNIAILKLNVMKKFKRNYQIQVQIRLVRNYKSKSIKNYKPAGFKSKSKSMFISAR